jgi:hypothetical protein
MATKEIAHPSFRCKLVVTRYDGEYGKNVSVHYTTDDGVLYGCELTIGMKNADGVPRTDAMCVKEAIQILLDNTA